MMRKIEVGSVFGRVQRISYEYMKLMNSKFNNSYSVLIIDDKDGLHSLMFAGNNAKVTMYEPNKVYIEGGEIEGINVTPITNRKHYYKTKKNLNVVNDNFYERKVERKYDFVFCYRSLHEKHNKHIPMTRKMRKLLSSVKEGGYIYIFYHMAKNEFDKSNFSRNQYFRENEMIDYFDLKNWEVISIKENKQLTMHKGHPYHEKDHTHKIGHIFARKKNNRLIHKYYYEIETVIKN